MPGKGEESKVAVHYINNLQRFAKVLLKFNIGCCFQTPFKQLNFVSAALAYPQFDLRLNPILSAFSFLTLR